ncbi:hypothetical protein BA896_021975 [Janthinobacterium lividum]|uniref:Uncharacterized protein n=1 Tax=Janthinobacterium lividum TaxID=29581 RepID=A0A1E8PJH0_9BURK|nr:hypothetical protein BA896_021975 [Janthinobacterium lividum]
MVAIKTVWFNTTVAALLLAEQNVDTLQGVIPEWLHKLAVFSLPIVNMGLRVISSQGIAFKPQMPQSEADK